ncbi:MAG: MaoC family dehydratase [Immundisolibacterales bacterium]|nr:MaoC family dehydratase [Immundisolibacterales bacterium]
MYFEDFTVGDTFVTASVEVTAEGIVEYARRYDPQPFHLDPVAAEASIYRGLIASGFHIFSMAFGEVARTGIFEGGGQGSPGIFEVRWVSPARPGDKLHTDITVLEKRLSRTRPDRGYVTMRFDTRNQRQELVATYSSNQIMLLRTPGQGTCQAARLR